MDPTAHLRHTVHSVVLDDEAAQVGLRDENGADAALVVREACWLVAAGAVGGRAAGIRVSEPGEVPPAARGALAPLEVTDHEWEDLVTVRVVEAGSGRALVEIVGAGWRLIDVQGRPAGGW